MRDARTDPGIGHPATLSLSGATTPFAVLGHPIGHTLSPAMHNAAFAERAMDAVYLAFDVLPERLTSVLESMADMGFGGVNLTVPHKEVAFRGLAKLDDSAQLLGAVNTVAFSPEGLTGHNTDGYGFLKAVEEAFGKPLAGASVFVLGTGGAGRAVALVSARQGAASIALADVDQDRAHQVANDVLKAQPGVAVEALADATGFADAANRADFVVHATPVGMKAGDVALLGSDAFRAGQCVFDLIYNLPDTPIMQSAAAAGAEVSNGLDMLLHQGAKAFSIWTGQEAPVDTMRRVLQERVYPG